MIAALRVLAPGLMTTLQDLGRPGYQRLGVPVSGALDHVSLRAANLLVGNAAGIGALEIAYQGPTLQVEADSVRIAVAGGRARIDILPADGDGNGGRHLAAFESARLLRGEVLRIGALTGSAVAYLAVEGGFDIAPVLGSQSTLIRAAIGGLEGRALKAGDLLPLRQGAAAEREDVMLPPLDLGLRGRVRVVLGPQDDHFTPAALRTLLESVYTVSQASDRMGMRLEGPHARALEQGLQHRLRRHRAWLHPGARQWPAHRPAGGPADHRRLSQGRDRHLRRHPRAGPHDARRKDNLRGGGHRGCRGRGPAARLRHRGHGQRTSRPCGTSR